MTDIIQYVELPLFIKGDYIDSLQFNLFDESGEPIDLTRVEPRLVMFPYGHADMPVEFDGTTYKVGAKSSTDDTLNQCYFTLTSEETASLEYNKYVFHVVLHFTSGTEKDIKQIEGTLKFKDSYNI